MASNAYYDNFKNGSYDTVDEIKQMCTKTGGAGINLRMVNNFIHLFKFNDILDFTETMLIYSIFPLQQMPYFKKSIRNI